MGKPDERELPVNPVYMLIFPGRYARRILTGSDGRQWASPDGCCCDRCRDPSPLGACLGPRRYHS